MSLDLDGKPNGGRDWRTFQIVVFALGLGSGVFAAGMSYGQSNATAARVDRLEQDFVRKDGRELAEIQGQFRLMNQKLDQLLRERGLPVQ